MDAIVEQLRENCDCFPDENVDEIQFEKLVAELIHLVSVMTCWTNSLCETFLNGEREEIFDAERVNLCTCDQGMLEFEPFYVPIYPETITAQLVIQNGVQDEVIIVSEEDIGYSETFGHVRINYQKYLKIDNCCCPENAKLVIRYVAGYEELPECLLPLFCDMLHIVYDKNDCSCDKCQECTQKYSDDEVEIYSDDDLKVEVNIEKTLNNLIRYAYTNSLGLMSLCGRKQYRIWGVVV